jgi:hypothetical protein
MVGAPIIQLGIDFVGLGLKAGAVGSLMETYILDSSGT